MRKKKEEFEIVLEEELPEQLHEEDFGAEEIAEEE